jgi:hypothetical protein
LATAAKMKSGCLRREQLDPPGKSTSRSISSSPGAQQRLHFSALLFSAGRNVKSFLNLSFFFNYSSTLAKVVTFLKNCSPLWDAQSQLITDSVPHVAKCFYYYFFFKYCNSYISFYNKNGIKNYVMLHLQSMSSSYKYALQAGCWSDSSYISNIYCVSLKHTHKPFCLIMQVKIKRVPACQCCHSTSASFEFIKKSFPLQDQI